MTPTAPRTPCPAPGCRRLRPCPDHARRRDRSRQQRRQRDQVLLEEPLCRLCRARSTTVDHIIPLWAGGTDERRNKQGLCDDCHRAKTRAERL